MAEMYLNIQPTKLIAKHPLIPVSADHVSLGYARLIFVMLFELGFWCAVSVDFLEHLQ